jgi:hypothetical protein
MGRLVDPKLLKDHGIVSAALSAGYKPDEILPQFKLAGIAPDGRPFEYHVKNGVWKVAPQFSGATFRIGLTGGKFSKDDLANAKRKMFATVLKQNPSLPKESTQTWVDSLFAQVVDRREEYKLYNDELKQGLRATLLPRKAEMSMTTNPCETEWAIGKILFEAGAIVLPQSTRRKFQSALIKIRDFVQQRRDGHLLLNREQLLGNATRFHEIGIQVGGSKVVLSIVLFGKEKWSVETNVLKNGRPCELPAFQASLSNDCSFAPEIGVKWIENGVSRN